MKRLAVLFILSTALLIFSARAQTKEAVLVLSSDSPEFMSVAQGFKGGFSGTLTEINLEGSDAKQRSVGEELKGKKPAVVIVVGDLAAQMAKWYLQDTPIVYCDAVRAAKISLTTGKTVGIYHEPDPVEQLKTIQKLFAGKSRIGVMYSPEYSKVDEAAIKASSTSLGLSLEISAMNSIKEVPAKLQSLIPKVDVLWVFTDPVILSSHSNQFIVLQSISAKVPIFCGDNGLAHAGATAALVPDWADAGAKAAAQVKIILGGTVPDKSITVYPRGKLVLNQKMAALFNISFPPALLGQAAEVIQ